MNLIWHLKNWERLVWIFFGNNIIYDVNDVRTQNESVSDATSDTDKDMDDCGSKVDGIEMALGLVESKHFVIFCLTCCNSSNPVVTVVSN